MSNNKKDPHADEFGINPALLAWAIRRRDNPDKFGEPTQKDLDLIKLAEKRDKDKPKKFKASKPQFYQVKSLKVNDHLTINIFIKDEEISKTLEVKKKQDGDYELISLDTSRTPESIRKSYFSANIDPADKAMIRGGSEALRNFYRGPSIRKRRLLEQGKKINWLCSNTIFKPSKEFLLKCQ